MVTPPVSVGEQSGGVVVEFLQLSVVFTLFAFFIGIIPVAVFPDLLRSIGVPGGAILFGLGSVVFVISEADTVLDIPLFCVIMPALALPGAVLVAAVEWVLAPALLTDPDIMTVWLLGSAVSGVSSGTLVLPEELPDRYRLTDTGIARHSRIPGRDLALIPYEDIEAVLRREDNGTTATYEVVRRNGPNLKMESVTTPERVEAVFNDFVERPELQRRRTRGSSRRVSSVSFWLLWPDDEPVPEEPVIDADRLGGTFGSEASNVDFDALDAVAETDGFEDFDDIGDALDTDVGASGGEPTDADGGLDNGTVDVDIDGVDP